MSRTLSYSITPSCAQAQFAVYAIPCPDGRIQIGGHEDQMINYKSASGDPFFAAAAKQYQATPSICQIDGTASPSSVSGTITVTAGVEATPSSISIPFKIYPSSPGAGNGRVSVYSGQEAMMIGFEAQTSSILHAVACEAYEANTAITRGFINIQ